MADSQPPVSASETVIAQPKETPVTPPTQKPKFNQLLIIGGMLLLLCLCIGVCIAAGGVGLFRVYQERAPIESVIDAFMRAMVEKDTDKAFALFSTRVQRQISMSDIEEMLEGNNYVLFEGYQSLEIQNINISKAVNTNQDLPQGTVATVDGIIFYDGDFAGTFDAVLEKEGAIWRLHRVNVIVPPNKIKP